MTLKFTLMGLGTSDIFPDEIEQFKRHFSLNTGNLLFNYATQLLCDLSPERIGWGASPSYVNKHCKGLIIPMANHLGEHVDLSVSGPKLENIDVPVVVLGIGVQSKLGNEPILPEGTKHWIEKVSKMRSTTAINISTRGQSSTDTIRKNTPNVNSTPLGCPSYLINRHLDLGKKILSRILSIDKSNLAIAVSAGNPYKKDLASLERSLINLVQEYHGIYIVQHPQVLLELSLGYQAKDDSVEIVSPLSNSKTITCQQSTINYSIISITTCIIRISAERPVTYEPGLKVCWKRGTCRSSG
jgi:hypothetical protein